MFNNKRYVTAGVNSTIDPSVQLFIWNLIEVLKSKIQVDYLQIFELSKIVRSDGSAQMIVHIQEIPHHRQEYILSNTETVDRKIYAIDDGMHCTMLLSEEY